MTGIRATNIEKQIQLFASLENDAVLESKTVIISTGASWRKLNIPGEDRLINKGVAFLLHQTDLYLKIKMLLSSVVTLCRRAIDLAGIVKHATLFEYASN